jgi:hypothetical protein
MSRPTPDDEYAAGIVSCLNHVPLAKEKKSTHALTDLSMYDGSMTLSGGSAFCATTGAEAADRATEARITERTWRQREFGFIVREVEDCRRT